MKIVLIFTSIIILLSLNTYAQSYPKIAESAMWSQIEITTKSYGSHIVGAWAEVDNASIPKQHRCAFGSYNLQKKSWENITYFKKNRCLL